jgi:drug/metabolite transporter (DMT)-like permease
LQTPAVQGLAVYELLLILTISINITADFIDRYSSNKSDAYVLTLWMSLVQFLLIFPLIGLVERISISQLLLIAGVGAFTSFGRIRWFRALSEKSEQLSRLAPFTRISSVIVLIVAVAVLGEQLSLNQALGASLIIIGAFLISFERWSARFRTFVSNNRALGLVIVFAVSNASLTVLYKYLLLSHVNTWTIYFYVKLFQAAPLLWYGADRNVLATSYLKIRNLKVFVFARVLQTAAAFLYLLVVKHLPLTTVEPIAALSPLLLILAERMIHWFQVSLPNRGMDEPAIAAKNRKPMLRFVAVIAMILGVLILGRV